MLTTEQASFDAIAHNLDQLPGRFVRALLGRAQPAEPMLDGMLRDICDALICEQVSFESFVDGAATCRAPRVWSRPGSVAPPDMALVVPVGAGGRPLGALSVGPSCDGEP